MGFVSEFKKAVSGEPAGDRFTIVGKPLVCSHCGGDRFFVSRAQLNTAAMTFLGFDWADESATVYECTACGKLEWFLE